MAIPYNAQVLMNAQQAAEDANQTVEAAIQIAGFLQTNLVTGFDTHHVALESFDFQDVLRSMVFRTPFGQVWGRLEFERSAHGLLDGAIQLFSVRGDERGGFALTRLHRFSFHRSGVASFDESIADGGDWDLRGDSMAPAAVGRTFARILLQKQLEQIPA